LRRKLSRNLEMLKAEGSDRAEVSGLDM